MSLFHMLFRKKDTWNYLFFIVLFCKKYYVLFWNNTSFNLSKIHIELSVDNHLLHTSFLRFPRSFIIICLPSSSYYLCTSKVQTKSGNSFSNHCQTAYYILGVCIETLFGIAQPFLKNFAIQFENIIMRLNIPYLNREWLT